MRRNVITDVVETRLKIAEKLAVDHTVLISPEQSEQEIIETILNTLGTTPNITIDACGFESAQRIALKVTIKLHQQIKMVSKILMYLLLIKQLATKQEFLVDIYFEIISNTITMSSFTITRMLSGIVGCLGHLPLTDI